MEGDSVTLQTNTELQTDTELQKNGVITWNFNITGPLLAKMSCATKIITIEEHVRFRDRLKVDNQTGSLTIMNTRITDSAVYLITISSNKRKTHIFNVTVYGE